MIEDFLSSIFDKYALEYGQFFWDKLTALDENIQEIKRAIKAEYTQKKHKFD